MGFPAEMPLDDLYDKIVSLEEFDVQAEIEDIIERNADVLIGYIRAQLASGTDGNGDPVTVFGNTEYSERALFEKKRADTMLGKFTGWITNFMTGEFYASIQVVPEQDGFFFTSDVPYFEDIIYQSGRKILELNEEHALMFKEQYLDPQFTERFTSMFENGL